MSADPPIAGALVRSARAQDVAAVLAFWRLAAEDTDRPVDRSDAVEGLIARDPDALLLLDSPDGILATLIVGFTQLASKPETFGLRACAADRGRAHGAIRIDAMVLDDNTDAHGLWSASGYARQDNWSRWVRPLH